ncbi:hypothetical protein SAMN05421789_11717 [Kaistella chaponensis]|uniref:Uncharacterized protein n=1 Tax=Kaistella chaponensis TaxID=713588 RepID=A0A1N7NSN4_9FLAO|nr:hypothetical protein [Kaistella chaponensis]SIT01344.1 hypothetical protein SAMN05421789_11717 [Kaistella chaponensis]
MTELVQKINRRAKTFKILDDGILVNYSNAHETQEYKISYSDIGNDEIISKSKKDVVLIFLMISMVFNAILITALIGDTYNLSIKTGIIFFFVALVPVFIIGGIYGSEFKKENLKTVSANKPLSFFYRKKDEKNVDDFISKIYEAKKNFLVKQYYKIDDLLPLDTQKFRIQWLYENKYISEEETKFILEEIETQRIIKGSNI